MIVNLQPSKVKPCWIITLSVIGFYAVNLNALEGWSLVAAILFWWVMLLSWLCRPYQESLEQVNCLSSGWGLLVKGKSLSGLSLLPTSAVTSIGLAVHLRSKHRRYYFWVAPDQCSKADYRKLIRYMRYQPVKCT